MNKGAIVKQIGESYIRDHYEMRILLESEAARRAAVNGMKAADGLLKKLYYVQNKVDTISSDEYEDLNLEVHTSIWMAARNERLYKFLSSLWNGPSIGHTTSKLEHYKNSTAEHIAIVEAISALSPDKAKCEMEHHIEHGMNNILKSYNFIK